MGTFLSNNFRIEEAFFVVSTVWWWYSGNGSLQYRFSQVFFVRVLENFQHFTFCWLSAFWCAQSAVVSTICLFVFPKRIEKPSRLEKLVNDLVSPSSYLSGVNTRKLRFALIFVGIFCTCNSICLALLEFYGHSSVARFCPWNGLLVYRTIHLVFGAYNSFSWLLPLVLFFASCEVLITMSVHLERKISEESSKGLSMKSLRQEHLKLCETVALADKVFSPILLFVVSLDVPLICINVHQGVRLSSFSNSDITFVISVSY